MKRKYDFLPRKLTKEEIALAPSPWVRLLSHYPTYRKKALKEIEPGYFTLLAAILAAIAKHDRSLIDVATELTKDNVPEHMYLSLVGSALSDFGEKDKSLNMLRKSVELQPSNSALSVLASEIDDLDEKASLAQKILEDNPKDNDALRHLAYAKYFKDNRIEAERMIDEILSDEPNHLDALEYKGNIYFDKEDYNKALEQYLKIKVRPTPISLQFKICHCYYLCGMISKAKKIAKKIQYKISLALDLEMDIESANKLIAEILKYCRQDG